MNRLLLAEALGRSPSSSEFRDLLTASNKYGFTRGNYNSDAVELTELGERLTKPRSQDERLDALREGMRNISVFDSMLTHYANSKLPGPEFIRNTLERAPFSVQPEWSEEVARLFEENGRDVGFVRSINAGAYVILEAGPPTAEEPGAPPPPDLGEMDPAPHLPRSVDLNAQDGAAEQPPVPALRGASHGAASNANSQFFIAHGWDKDALVHLEKILKGFGIPFVVADEEANVGRPISEKVRDLMKSCSAGIFIFSADEELTDAAGIKVWRPRENVIYELGAASLEYGRRIVIFKEKSVTFPSDFRDLGYIEFEKGNLEAKAMELLRELIALGAVKIMAGV